MQATDIKTCRHCSATSDQVEFYPTAANMCKECSKRIAREIVAARRVKYGRLYSVWAQMRYRAKHHPDYAGRGIIVCDEWNSFHTFYDWAIANGYKQGLEIDRRDNDGNYSPSNCRWVTRVVNGRNRRTVKLNEESAAIIKRRLLNGETRTQIATDFNVSQATIGDIDTGRGWADVLPSATS